MYIFIIFVYIYHTNMYSNNGIAIRILKGNETIKFTTVHFVKHALSRG